MPPEQQTLEQKINRLSQSMKQLGTGPLAELRRMAADGPGTTDFWHLAGLCGFLEDKQHTDPWMRIVKIMAILTPKGEPVGRPLLHDKSRSLGTILCDGGRHDWSAASDTPFLSETRLARFLTQRPEQRAEALERQARALAARRDPQIGINCADIAALLLYPDNESHHLRELARTYYRRLDSAARKTKEEETNP